MDVYRFAPSPNGHLHLGHAYSALLNSDCSQRSGGRFLVRIEDIDTARCTPDLEWQMLDDLDWLGLDWEQPVRRQSDHFADYRAALDTLVEAGLAYPSSLSRGDIRRIAASAEERGQVWPRDPDGALLFPGRAYEDDDEADGAVWRLDVSSAMDQFGGQDLGWEELGAGPDGETGWQVADPTLWGDFVLARRDAPTSYHLAVVVDDALQGVTHVVRGRDLFHATAAHVLLQEVLGLPRPIYHHHDLVLDADGRKLSKSRGDTALVAMRHAGITPGDIRSMVGL